MKKVLIFFCFTILFVSSCKEKIYNETCLVEQFERDMLLQIQLKDMDTQEDLLSSYKGQTITLSLLRFNLPDLTPTEPEILHEWNAIAETTTTLEYLFDSGFICGAITIYRLQIEFEDGITYNFEVDFDSVLDDDCFDCQIDFIERISAEGLNGFFEYGGEQDRVLTIFL